MKRDKRGKSDNRYIFTKETMGLTLILFSVMVLVMLFSFDTVFAGVGKGVCTFMYGTFGYGSIPLMLAIAYLGEWLAFEKSFKISFKSVICISLTVFCFFMLFHAVTTRNFESASYGAYLSDCYVSAAEGWDGYTFGGVVSGLLVYPVANAGGYIVAYIAYAVLTLLFGYLSYLSIRKIRPRDAVKVSAPKATVGNAEEIAVAREAKPRTQVEVDHLYTVNPDNEIVQTRIYGQSAEKQPVQQTKPAQQYQQTSQRQPVYQSIRQTVPQSPVQQDSRDAAAEKDKYSRENLGRKIIFEKGEFAAESYKRNMIFSEESYFNHPVINKGDYLSSFSSGEKQPSSYSESYQNDVAENPAYGMPSGYVYGEKPVESLSGYERAQGAVYSASENTQPVSDPVKEYPVPDFGASDNDFSSDSQYTDYSDESPVEDVQPSNQDYYEDKYRVEDAPYVPEEPVIDEPSLKNVGFGGALRNTEDEQPPKYVSENEEKSEPIVNGKPANDFSNIFGADSLRGNSRIEPDTSRLTGRGERSNAELFDGDDDDDVFAVRSERMDRIRPVDEGVSSPRRVGNDVKNDQPVTVPAAAPVKEEKPKHVWKQYVHPPMELLDDYPENNNVNTGEIEANKRIIIETLERFKITSEISNVTIGPAITRYDVVIEDKVNIKRSLSYRETISMALMKDNVNVYLNYSKGALSIEVPNNARTTVGLKSMLVSPKFINAKKNSLTFALGKNVEGEVVCPDITKMPHLLVAGTTGSGKSICLSSLLISLLYKYGPEELRLILVDPKQVEFISYDKLPHLMINEILYDVDKALKALNWAIKEMERRYSLFKEMTEAGTATKNLEEYNAHLPEGEEKLPKILIVLDEFGDLMLQAKKEIEGKIIKLVQKARACGIHLILATQRPSVDCITGLIKSNLPTRIGFKVNSFDDSRTIFDIGGAEKLLGMGDMYFRSTDNPDLARIQGCFVNTHEVQKVTDFIKANNETYFDQSVSDFINTVEQPEEVAAPSEGGEEVGETKIDDTFIKALKYCVTSNQASVSMIQRRFPVGYIKACKIIDWMEDMNYITKSEGSKPRKVLLSKEEFVNTYGEDVDD